jgi:phosphopantothenate-cysteine ligase
VIPVLPGRETRQSPSMASPPRGPAPTGSQPFSTESYFQSQRPPPGLEDKNARMHEFVRRWKAVEGKRVVLVTVRAFVASGRGRGGLLLKSHSEWWYHCTSRSQYVSDRGIAELGCVCEADYYSVRFLDNFSAGEHHLLAVSCHLTIVGTRGATSAEYFLSAGYAVIFLHRVHSLRPFSRHYSHSLNPFLDLLSVIPSSSSSTEEQPQIIVPPPHASKLLPVLRAYNAAQEEGTLLQVDFHTVNEYLWLLKGVSAIMAPLGRRGMFYLAAAVSDFFLPEERTVSCASSFVCKAEDFRRSTRFSLSMEHSPSRWTRCRKCSDRSCRNGRRKGISSASRCVSQFAQY